MEINVRFLRQDATGALRFDEYFEHIESIRHQLSSEAYEFASNFEHYNLQSKSSLHDAWVQSVQIEESASGPRKEVRQLGVRISLLGSYHDRILLLTYDQVSAYAMSAQCGVTQAVAHGDILTHEVRKTDGQQVVHEILFASGSTFLVECRDLRFEVAMISA
jgi:hypothetical protein